MGGEEGARIGDVVKKCEEVAETGIMLRFNSFEFTLSGIYK